MPVTAGGGIAPEPKKKKKTTETRLPVTETTLAPEQQQAARPGIVRHQEVLQAAAKTTFQVERETRKYLKGELVAPAVRQDVLSAIDHRASLISPRLLAMNPNLAAELLMGDTKTRDLSDVSHAAFEGWMEQQRATLEAQSAADMRAAYMTNPEAYLVASAINRDDVTAEYAQSAQHLKPDQREFFMAILAHAAQMPDGKEREAALGILPMWFQYAQEGRLEPDQSLLQQATGAVGRGFSLAWNATYGKYIWLSSHAADLFGDDNIVDTVQGYAGGALKTTETGVQFATRNVEGALTAAEIAFMEHASNKDISNLTPDQLWTSWGEVEEGTSHSPVTEVIAEAMETTTVDPRYQGLFGAIDMAADLGVQIAAFKLLGSIKTSLRATIAGGGGSTGEMFVNSRLMGGKRYVKVGWETIKNLNPDARFAALLGKFRKMTPTMARDVARATSEDQFARLSAHAIDDVSSIEIPKVQKAINAIDDELKVEAESQGGVRPGNESYVHETDVVNLQSIIDNGLHKSTGGSAGGSEGVYVQEAARTAQRIVDGLVPEDRILIEVEASPTRLTGQAAEGAAVRNLKGDVLPEDIVSIRDHQGNILYERPTAASEGSAVRTAALEAERASLDQRKLELQNGEVQFEFPRISHVRPFMRGIGVDSWTGRVLNHLFGESGKFDVSAFTNDLTSRDGYIHDLSAPSKVKNRLTHNIDVLRKTMNVVRVDKDTQGRIFEAMLRVERGELAFFDFRKMLNEAYRSGKKWNPELERALRFSEQSVEARMHSPVQRRYGDRPRDTKLENAAMDEHGNPLPTRVSQLLDDTVSIPDMRALESGSSAIARFDAWAKDKPFIGKATGMLRTSAAWANLVLLEIPRLVLRPSFLVSQLPRLFTKIEFDQSLRAFIAENINPMDWFDGRVRNTLTRHKTELDPTTGAPLEIGTLERTRDPLTGKEDRSALGLAAHEVLSEVTSVSSHLSTAGLERRPADIPLVTKSIHNHIEELAVDPIAQRVALDGPEATLRWIEANPANADVIAMRERVMPKLEEKGYTLEQVINDLDAEINYASGGDLALRKSIATRKWEGEADHPTPHAQARQEIADELVQAREQLGLTEDGILRREINLRIEELERRDAWLANKPQTQKTISLDDDAAFRSQIEENWRAGAYDMPNDVIVQRPTLKAKSDGTPQTRLERTRAAAQRLNRTLYKGFKVAEKPTWNMSRGSTFRKVAERIEKKLLERGYSLDDARLHANARAMFITKDLHYDISARSSIDRKVQNLFWFAPVWREQLAVYLFKIPQKAFWGPGLALEIGMAHTFIEGLKNMGLVEDRVVYTDPDTGEESIHPFFVLPNGTGVDIGGMHPLTPASEEVGQPPTLSPGAESILDFTATHVPDELKPFVKGIAEYFSFDGDVEHGSNWIPRSLTLIPEWFGLHIPSETFSNWVDYDNKVDLQVTKLAMSQLAEEGTVPPTPGAYENENSYHVALQAYREKLDAARRQLEKGIFATHLISRTLVPGTVETEGTDLYAEDGAAQAFYDWRDTLDPNLSTEDYYAAVNQYVAKHPEAFPYSVGSHDYQGTRTGNWYETEAYRNSPLLDEEAYVDKALGQVHYWSEDEPAPELSETERAARLANSPKAFDNLSPRRKARTVAEWMTIDVQDLTETQATAVGLPKFYGRDDLLRTIGEINRQYDDVNISDKSDNVNDLLENHRDYLLERAAGQYGDQGKAVLQYIKATPAVRLNRAGHFTGNEASIAIARAGAVKRAVYAKYPEASMAGAAESYGTLQKKAEFFEAIDRMRTQSPDFDRQMRYAELGLGKNDNPIGRTLAYQILFFGEPFYDSDLAKAVIEWRNK